MESLEPKPIDTGALVSLLNKFWDDQMDNASLSAEPFELGPAMDSMTACKVHIDVEELLKIGRLPLSLIKSGGYESKEEFLKHYEDGLTSYLSKKEG